MSIARGGALEAVVLDQGDRAVARSAGRVLVDQWVAGDGSAVPFVKSSVLWRVFASLVPRAVAGRDRAGAGCRQVEQVELEDVRSRRASRRSGPPDPAATAAGWWTGARRCARRPRPCTRAWICHSSMSVSSGAMALPSLTVSFTRASFAKPTGSGPDRAAHVVVGSAGSRRGAGRRRFPRDAVRG